MFVSKHNSVAFYITGACTARAIISYVGFLYLGFVEELHRFLFQD